MDFNFKNLKPKEKVGIGVVIALILFFTLNPFKDNSSNFTGSIGKVVEVPSKQACEANVEYLQLFDSLNSVINGLNKSGINLEANRNEVRTIAISIASIVNHYSEGKSIESDCQNIQLLTLNMVPYLKGLSTYELIEVINGSVLEINSAIEKCENCSVSKLVQLEAELNCLEGKEINAENFECEVPPITECSYLEIYNNGVKANNLLIKFKDNPNGFRDSEKSNLNELLKNINENAFKKYIDEFDYLSEAENLSQMLVLVTDKLINSGVELCDELSAISMLQIESSGQIETEENSNLSNSELEDVLNSSSGTTSENSCPANSIYDEVVQECYCALSDSFIGFNGSCSGDQDEAGEDVSLQSELEVILQSEVQTSRRIQSEAELELNEMKVDKIFEDSKNVEIEDELLEANEVQENEIEEVLTDEKIVQSNDYSELLILVYVFGIILGAGFIFSKLNK
jgi:hypothetical protein